MRRAGTGALLLLLGIITGFASAPSYGLLLAATVAAEVAAIYFLWPYARVGKAGSRIVAWASIVGAVVVALQALLRIAFHWRPTEILG